MIELEPPKYEFAVNASIGHKRLQVLIESDGFLDYGDRERMNKRHPTNDHQNRSRLNESGTVAERKRRNMVDRIMQP